MPMPVLALPVLQQWDCHNCGDCCRSYAVRVTALESARIEGQGWHADRDLAGLPAVVTDGRKGLQLNHRADGGCVFLNADNTCRIHAKFGAAAKPMACRIYPFVLVPAGDHWRAGLRLACPSAVKNLGRPIADHQADLDRYAGLLEADAEVAPTPDQGESPPPPELVAGQTVPWPDLVRFAAAFAGIMAEEAEPVEHRLRRWIALSAVCRTSRFDRMSGSRLDEFLQVVSAAVDDDVPTNPHDLPPPSRAGRMIFRQFLAIYSRRDAGRHPGIASRGRWTRVSAAWRYALGRGAVPKLHGLFPDTSFAVAEAVQPPPAAESEALLKRYFLLKLESLQFCGPSNFRRPVWAGLDSLVLTYPVIRWLANVFAADGKRSGTEALEAAVQQVDDSFGFNPLLAPSRQAWAIQTLADRNDLAKLVAWYGRST